MCCFRENMVKTAAGTANVEMAARVMRQLEPATVRQVSEEKFVKMDALPV
jgi:hypothetical protein